jgi:tRNA(Arg) A34 adenosine deaminase TadA
MTQNDDDDTHKRYIERTFELAREAGERGDGPYGSILVVDDAVVMEAQNRERTDDDIASHPELALARRGAYELSPKECARAIMYTSTEPCPMCAGGIAIAGLGGVVYSVSAEHAAEEFGDAAGIPCSEVFERLGHDVDVIGGIRETDGLAIHRTYREV